MKTIYEAEPTQALLDIQEAMGMQSTSVDVQGAIKQAKGLERSNRFLVEHIGGKCLKGSRQPNWQGFENCHGQDVGTAIDLAVSRAKILLNTKNKTQ